MTELNQFENNVNPQVQYPPSVLSHLDALDVSCVRLREMFVYASTLLVVPPVPQQGKETPAVSPGKQPSPRRQRSTNQQSLQNPVSQSSSLLT